MPEGSSGSPDDTPGETQLPDYEKPEELELESLRSLLFAYIQYRWGTLLINGSMQG